MPAAQISVSVKLGENEFYSTEYRSRTKIRSKNTARNRNRNSSRCRNRCNYCTKKGIDMQESFVYSTTTEVYTYEHEPIDVYKYILYTHSYTTDKSALTTNK